jgi:serine protease AprX
VWAIGNWVIVKGIRLTLQKRQIQKRWLHFLALALIIGVNMLVVDGGGARAQAVTPAAIPEDSDAVQVSPYLTAALASGAKAVSMLILLKDQPDLAALEAAISASSEGGAPLDISARRTALYQQLTTHALASQADLRAWLDAQGIPYRAHYIVNMISVTGDAALVAALRQRPDVARLDANPVVEMIDKEMFGAKGAVISRAPVNRWTRLLELPAAAASPNTPYGVTATRAPEVWARGYTGQGITVASQDTGVAWDQPALQPHYRGTQGATVDHTYNWLDAIPETGAFDGCAGLDSPCDDNGHGTHTVGTMIGTTDVITYGAAPGAQWMGCRNMRGGVGTPETYTTCFEFFLAPYPPNGDPFTDGRPDLAPHIINNSWGCPEREGCNKDSLRQVVETVRAAGLMVVASAGNNGAGCSTVIDPIAIYDATFSVGAHDENGNLAGFSSRGPVTADGSGRLKPDLTAPGVGVLSTSRFGGASTLSGTSMASPHVAGAAALLWSAAPWLVGNVDLTEQLLLKSATPVNSTECGGGDAVSPNNAFGYGMLDVAAAVEMALQPWHVTVTVTNGVGAPLVGGEVMWIDANTGYSTTATTDMGGVVTISPTLIGTYSLQVRDEAGIVEIDNITLPTDGGEPIIELVVFYDAAQVPYPSRHYLPGIMLN